MKGTNLELPKAETLCLLVFKGKCLWELDLEFETVGFGKDEERNWCRYRYRYIDIAMGIMVEMVGINKWVLWWR